MLATSICQVIKVTLDSGCSAEVSAVAQDTARPPQLRAQEPSNRVPLPWSQAEGTEWASRTPGPGLTFRGGPAPACPGLHRPLQATSGATQLAALVATAAYSTGLPRRQVKALPLPSSTTALAEGATVSRPPQDVQAGGRATSCKWLSQDRGRAEPAWWLVPVPGSESARSSEWSPGSCFPGDTARPVWTGTGSPPGLSATHPFSHEWLRWPGRTERHTRQSPPHTAPRELCTNPSPTWKPTQEDAGPRRK